MIRMTKSFFHGHQRDLSLLLVSIAPDLQMTAVKKRRTLWRDIQMPLLLEPRAAMSSRPIRMKKR